MARGQSRTARAARRRKRRMARGVHDLTTSDWAALQERWAGCAYCGTTTGDLQRDCVLPISRGGRYTIDNVVPACRSCNTSKCNAEVTTWMRRKRLDERTFLIRYAEIVSALRAATFTGATGDGTDAVPFVATRPAPRPRREDVHED